MWQSTRVVRIKEEIYKPVQNFVVKSEVHRPLIDLIMDGNETDPTRTWSENADSFGSTYFQLAVYCDQHSNLLLLKDKTFSVQLIDLAS